MKPQHTNRGSGETHSRVLIVVHTTTFLTELVPYGKLLRNEACAETVFFCTFVDPSTERFAEACAREGVTCLLPPLRESLLRAGFQIGANAPFETAWRKARRFISHNLARVAARLPGIGSKFVAEWLGLAAEAQNIRILLSAIQPRLLVLGGDMAGYDTSLYIQLAHDAGVRTLIVPSTMSNGEEQAEIYHGDRAYHVRGWIGQLIAAVFPKWVRSHRGLRLFRCPPARILAMELAGLSPALPWVFNSGAADAIAMESQAMIDYYAAAGLKGRHMVLTGSMSDDAMFGRLASTEELRRRLCAELDFDPACLLVLSALPPDFLYLPGGRPQCDFPTYDSLVDFWIDSLSALGDCNCVIALHPSVDAASMRHIERRNVRIASWKTADMVPLCDIYAASISSTIRWAIACGKPVVNYDVYRYRYSDFLNVPGVLATEEQAEFRSILHRLTTDAGYRDGVAQAQRSAASHWGMFDGRVGERLLALTEQLSGIGKHAAPAYQRAGDAKYGAGDRQP